MDGEARSGVLGVSSGSNEGMTGWKQLLQASLLKEGVCILGSATAKAVQSKISLPLLALYGIIVKRRSGAHPKVVWV